MKRRSSIAKVAAVISAVALLVVYVYDQAGGNILQTWRDRRSKVMYSSKSGMVIPSPSIDRSPVTTTENKPKLLPGSKFKAVFPVPTSGPPPDANVPKHDFGLSFTEDVVEEFHFDRPIDQTNQRRILLPPSKAPKVTLFNGTDERNSSASEPSEAQR